MFYIADNAVNSLLVLQIHLCVDVNNVEIIANVFRIFIRNDISPN